jgi:hypothetical protein
MDSKTLELFQTFCGYYIFEPAQSSILSIDFDVRNSISTSVTSSYSKANGATKFVGEFNFNTLTYVQTRIGATNNITKQEQSGFDFDSDDSTLYLQYLNWQQETTLNKNKLIILKKLQHKDKFTS